MSDKDLQILELLNQVKLILDTHQNILKQMAETQDKLAERIKFLEENAHA